MKKLILVILLFTMIGVNVNINYINANGVIRTNRNTKINEKLNIYSEAAVLMDMKTGKILYNKNIHEKLYPASTTKIMTAIVALENGGLDSVVTVGRDAANVEPTKIGLKTGERIKLKYLLYALMVDSANDAALAIADYVGGSVKNFARLMNKKAAAIGCRDTHFVNPNGLPDRHHYTSAYDLAIMTRYAMRNPTFRKLVSTVNYKIPATNKTSSISLINHNKMLYRTAYYYPGCIGVKTGYTVSSKHTLVSAAVRGNTKLIAVILKDPVSPYRGIITMFNYGFGTK